MHGKPLSALLQILRAHGVAEYQLTTEDKDGKKSTVSLKLGPAPARRAGKDAVEINVSPEALDAERRQELEDDEPEDMRFYLETSPRARRHRRHFPAPKADPRKNPQ